MKNEWHLMLILVVLAAVPRLCCLDLAEFKLDEANHFRMAYDLTRGSWRWTGSTASVGFLKPPLFVYVLAFPAYLSHDPRVAVGFLGVLAAMANGLFYAILRRYLNCRAAFIAGLLFALNPQAILYGRKLFTADLIPPLSTLLLGVATGFLESTHRTVGRWAMIVAFVFALLILNTFSPMILAPVIGVLFWERRRDLQAKYWIGAVLVFTLPFLPYVITVIPQVAGALAGMRVGHSARAPIWGWLWTLLFGAPWPSNIWTPAGAFACLMLGCTVLGIGYLFSEARSTKWARVWAVWLCGAPLLGLVVPVEMKVHYLVLLYPLIFLLPALAVDFISRYTEVWGWVLFAGMFILALWQGQMWLHVLQDVSVGVEGYGTPLGYWRRAAVQARQLARQLDAEELVLLVPGDQPWDEAANILDAMLRGFPSRVVNGYTAVLLPSHRAVLVVASEVAAPVAIASPCTQDLGVTLAASPFGGMYDYRLWDPDARVASRCADALLPGSAVWASGAALVGYGLDGEMQPGEIVHVTLDWRVVQGPLDKDVHWFNHLLDAEGRRWGQFDGVGFPAARWRPGDRILFHFDVALSTDMEAVPVTLFVGQYEYPLMENIPVLDVAGKPHAPGVELSLAPQVSP